MLPALSRRYQMAMLSGDAPRDLEAWHSLFPGHSELRFEQSPRDKSDYVRQRRAAGARILMVGDGLNDAGALRQSDVGAAVVEESGAFSPASDIIMTSGNVTALDGLMELARSSVRVVRGCLALSAAYNAAGIVLAARGWLSPVVCAILMPLSSATVAGAAVLWTRRAARRHWGRAGNGLSARKEAA
jgi:Cu+-exporting ATPase